MIGLHHLPHRSASTLARAGRSFALSFVLVAGLAGCGHKALVTLPQISMAPIDLEEMPGPDDPPMIAEEPAPDVPPPSQPVEPPKPVVRRRPAPAKETTPPVQVAIAPSVEPDAALAIGALSSGGDSAPQSQQQAKELISAIMKRLAALPGKAESQVRDQVRQVNYFLKQAQQALDSGDAEGAKNLATKARLLMDDLEKK